MKLIATALAASTVLTLSVPVAAQDREERAEAAFQELVEGRVAGEPQACISAMNPNRIDVVEYVGITYEQGDTLWVARARNADRLTVWDVPIFERRTSQLCRYDATRTIDRTTGMFSGVLFLEDFVPWTLIDADNE